MLIQWYPGHMAKAERKIKEETSKADIIVVLGDARAVEKSVNSDFYKSIRDKKHITVYNKVSLADRDITDKWKKYFKTTEQDVFFTDCVTGEGISEVADYIKSMKNTFRFEREARAIVAGIPNVGKSLFINTLTKKGGAKTGNMPGVTRGTNWIKSGEFYLLDTPGVLPPKFVSQEDGVLLAMIGCVKDTILDKEDLSFEIIKFLLLRYPALLEKRYKITVADKEPIEIYEAICEKRGFIIKGGEYDYARCANTVIDEFKNGIIGQVSLSAPEVH